MKSIGPSADGCAAVKSLVPSAEPAKTPLPVIKGGSLSVQVAPEFVDVQIPDGPQAATFVPSAEQVTCLAPNLT
jgi:hypothetical protein